MRQRAIAPPTDARGPVRRTRASRRLPRFLPARTGTPTRCACGHRCMARCATRPLSPAAVFSIELNSATTMPLVFDGDSVVGRKFSGEPLAFQLDYLAIRAAARFQYLRAGASTGR